MTWALLISLFIKSSLVAAAGLACVRFVAWRPVDRVDILRATVCLLLALPVITLLLPAIDLAVLPPLPVEATPAIVPWAPAAPPAAPSWPLSFMILGGAWLLGVVLIAGRLLLGLRTLRRWTQAADPVTCPDWRAPIERLPLTQRPRLVSSERVSGPLSWGLAPGAIVVDPATLTERQAAPAIMAHELAHLRRRDWLFLVLSRLALALFWFNPLVWRLHAALAERSEEAADAAALRSVDRTLYARTLVRLAAAPAAGAATAMAADARTLKTRIACIMTNTSDRRRPLTLGLTVVALAAIATPLAALGLSRQDAPPVRPFPRRQWP
jgi:beta-lactamase regulating signal transducer with metallopeptidase domain